MLSPAEDSSNPAGLGRATIKASASPQDEYFRYMLMKEKLGAGSSILSAKSEQDEVEIKILEKLINVRESTPEWNQVVDLTGSKNRFEQARILAEIAYEKEKAEKVLSFYVPSKATLAGIFQKTDDDAIANRQGRGAGGAGGLGGTANRSGATALASSLGLGGGGATA
jgi:hypothetical protein